MWRIFMRLLDRYVLRSFLEPFFICFLAFLGILLVFDLNDNLADFVEAKAKWKQVGVYYLHQLPNFILLSMPIGLLLALLYSLSRMSRSNEIISMLASGRSVLRVLLPLFVCGLVATGVCLWLNYELAPRSTAVREADLKRFKSDRRAEALSVTESLLAKDRQTNRIWFIRRVDTKKDGMQLFNDVNVTQLDDEGKPSIRFQAQGAFYVPRDGKWVLNLGRKIEYDREGNIVGEIDDWSKEFTARGSRSYSTWRETPYRIFSTTFVADQMSVPELREYLEYNADFPPAQLAPFRTNLQYRWALPAACFAVVLIAAPLGIVFSRRAVLASVAASLFLFFAYLFLMFLMLALGKGGYVSPAVAAWTPDAALAVAGCYLLYLRSTNREFPRLSFGSK
jgi:lipopolysaccharide export system permease protein